MTHAELVLSSHSRDDGRQGGAGGGLVLPASGSGAAAATPRAASADAAVGPKPPALASADWARRGALAERLGHAHDARTAYRVAVTLGFSLASYLALLRLEAQAGAVADALMSAQQVLLWHEARAAAVLGAPAKAGGAGAPAATLLARAPAPVAWFLAELAAAAAAQAGGGGGGSAGAGAQGGAARLLRALEEDAAEAPPHPLLARTLEAWARQQELDEAALASPAAASQGAAGVGAAAAAVLPSL